jgi:hypothetical protein
VVQGAQRFNVDRLGYVRLLSQNLPYLTLRVYLPRRPEAAIQTWYQGEDGKTLL